MHAHPMLTTAIKAARRAGNLIVRASRDINALKIEQKSSNDFVSEVDRAAEATIIETILSAYPSHAILAEEGGAQAGAADAEYTWIIDPLDGTTNFLHGFPHYAVSIALQHRGITTHAVVYDPNRNDLFVATRGSGAYLNDRRIRVSQKKQLSEALLTTGLPYRDHSFADAYFGMLRSFTEKSQGVRRPGAASLDLAYLAMGAFDGFWEFGLAQWDIAAGVLLVQEAGGLVSDFAGDENFMLSGNIVAGTPRVFGQMLPVIAAHLPAA